MTDCQPRMKLEKRQGYEKPKATQLTAFESSTLFLTILVGANHIWV